MSVFILTYDRVKADTMACQADFAVRMIDKKCGQVHGVLPRRFSFLFYPFPEKVADRLSMLSVSRPCHSCSIPRIKRAQSNRTEPCGNNVPSPKKLDSTFRTAKGWTCQVTLRSSRPSNSPGVAVT